MYNLKDIRHRCPYLNKNVTLWNPRARSAVHNSILELVGNTPLVKLNKIPKEYGLECEIYAKCEFLNPGGSIKDRIALGMMKDAEQNGNVTSKTIFVEPTSGNTGIGVAFNAALRENKCIIVTKEKSSDEKVSTMRLMGAEVIQVKTASVKLAHKIHDDDPENVIILNQFENPANPRTHYETTAEEIINALGHVDMYVAGAGTGGTITGVGTKLKEHYPNCQVIAGEPDGSTIFNVHGKRHSYLVEGIGGTNASIVLDKSVADGYEVINDEEAFVLARKLAQKEGLLCGASSGLAMAAAIKAAKKMNLGVGKRVVVILTDGIRNYMSKFITDQWMEAQLFIDPPEHTMRWWKDPITKLTPHHEYPVIDPNMTCQQAILEMDKEDVAVVVNDSGWFIGAVSKDSFRNYATNPTKLPGQDSEDFNFTDPVSKHLVKHCFTLAKNGKKGIPTIGLLSRILDITPFVVIGKNTTVDDEVHFIPESVATADDILDFIVNYKKIS